MFLARKLSIIGLGCLFSTSIAFAQDTKSVVVSNLMGLGMPASLASEVGELTGQRGGSESVGFGPGALSATSTGIHNTAIGSNALSVVTSGYSNSCVGSDACKLITTGFFNIAVGGSTLRKLTSGSRNVGIGHFVLGEVLTGIGNVGVGDDALNVSTGNYNTAIGVDSMLAITGDNNTGVGNQTLMRAAAASGNVALGFHAGAYETGSNAFYVDNQDRTNEATSKTSSLLYGTFNATPASQTLTVNGFLTSTSFAIPKGTTIPATCVQGSMFLDTNSDNCADGAGDGAVCVCKTTNTWALVTNI